ncbi:MAG: hypothetical protein U1E53_32230 [Dongiaceae bacterium]
MPRALRAVALGLLLALAGCNAAPPPPAPLPELTWGRLPPFELDVSTVAIDDAYRPAPGGGHVENEMPVPPAVAAERWARDRLRAVGRAGTARFTIAEASVVAVPLSRNGGLSGTFTDQQTLRYDARLSVRLEVENLAQGRSGMVTAEASRSQTVAEKATPEERRRLQFALVEALLEQVNGELEKSIPLYLGPYLR